MIPSNTDLSTWLQAFLRAPGGNIALADGLLLEPRSYFGPFHVFLSDLKRCCGPEPGMPYPVSTEDFERRVGGLQAFLRSGQTPAPLVVQFTGGQFVLTDGNHRHEAMVREGRREVAVVVWTTGDQERREFLDRWGVWMELERFWEEGVAEGREGVVGCLVVGSDGRVFAQRRSPDRKTFPGCWDLVGGHGEPGESPRAALVRELWEETGWHLDRVLGLRKVVDWELSDPEGPRLKRELVVAVTITGNPLQPRLEVNKVTEGRWFGPGDLDVLRENRQGGDLYVHDLVREELAR